MTTPTIDLCFFSNEDLTKAFSLRTGTAAGAPLPLTGKYLLGNVADADGVSVYALDSRTNHGLIVTDEPGGKFTLAIPHAALREGRWHYLYDLLIVSGDAVKRLWGGAITQNVGITAYP